MKKLNSLFDKSVSPILFLKSRRWHTRFDCDWSSDVCSSDLAGVEAIVMNASGCGVTVKEYGHILADDPAYADKAARISALTKDLSELLPALVPVLRPKLARQPHAVQPAARPQARPPRRVAAGGDRQRQHRLHHPPAERHGHAGAALGRAAG